MGALEKYRLFIDETGNHHYGHNSGKYLGLVGVIVRVDEYIDQFKPALLQLKQKFFSDDPDVPVVLHREDMVKRDGIFQCLADKAHRLRFNVALIEFMREQSYHLISVVIDKPSHKAVFGDSAKHPYHYCSEALLERFFYFLRDRNGVGDVIAESRGTDQDRMLNREWKQFCNRGTYYVRREALAKRLTVDEMKFNTKQDNIYGLQLADLLVRATTREVLIKYEQASRHKQTFDHLVSQAIVQKYRTAGNGCPKGWGMKFLQAQKKPAPLRGACSPPPIGRETTPEGAVITQVSAQNSLGSSGN